MAPKRTPVAQPNVGPGAFDSGSDPLAEFQARTNYTGRRSKWTIHPDGNPFLLRWDSTTLIALGFTCFVTPYEVAYLQSPMEFPYDPLYWMNRLIDIIFMVDICLQFFIAYEEHHRVLGVKWVTNQRRIVFHYMRGWFFVDVLSTIPFDMIGTFSGNPSLKKLKVMRTIRLLRLVKLMRILRASRLVARYQTEIGISYRLLSLAKFGTALILCGHWMGCFFGLVGVMQEEAGEDFTWITHFRITFYPKLDTNDQLMSWDLYIASLYWSVMTLTSIGYGDVGAQTTVERMVVVVCMLAGGCLWAFIIGNVCGMLASLDREKLAYFESLDALNLMVSERAIPRDMRRRLRMYWQQARALKRLETYRDLTGKMSPILQSEVAFATNEFWLKRVWFFQRVSRECLADIFQKVGTSLFEPNESFAQPWTLYVLNKGVVARKGSLATHGAVWGEEQLLLYSYKLLEDFQAVALSYVELMTLLRGDFEEVLEKWPGEAAHVRAAYRKCAFIACIKHFAMENGMKKKEKKNTIMKKWVEGMDTGKTVHLGHGDTNPDWDGKEHLSLTGLINWKVDELDDRVQAGRTFSDAAFGQLQSCVEKRLGSSRSTGKASECVEPNPEPTQDERPKPFKPGNRPGSPGEQPVTWEQLKPFLVQLESLHAKLDKLLERPAPEKHPHFPGAHTPVPAHAMNGERTRQQMHVAAPWGDLCSRVEKHPHDPH